MRRYHLSFFYVLGYDGISSLSTVECYEPTVSKKWKNAAPMNKQRSAAGIAVLNGKIYVMGGHDGMSIFNSVRKLRHAS